MSKKEILKRFIKSAKRLNPKEISRKKGESLLRSTGEQERQVRRSIKDMKDLTSQMKQDRNRTSMKQDDYNAMAEKIKARFLKHSSNITKHIMRGVRTIDPEANRHLNKLLNEKKIQSKYDSGRLKRAVEKALKRGNGGLTKRGLKKKKARMKRKSRMRILK